MNTRISAVAQSTFDGSANWISSVNSVNSACNNALYMPFEDKEMFAVALSAQVNKLNVEVYYDTAAAAIDLPGYDLTSPCRIVAINIKYVE